MKQRFPNSVISILEKAGWSHDHTEARPYSIPLGFKIFPAAEAVLREFAGYRIGRCSAGVECAACDINMDPSLASDIKEEIDNYSNRTGKKLFPVGAASNEDLFILVDEEGRAYSLFDEIIEIAATFDDALIKLLLGYK